MHYQCSSNKKKLGGLGWPSCKANLPDSLLIFGVGSTSRNSLIIIWSSLLILTFVLENVFWSQDCTVYSPAQCKYSPSTPPRLPSSLPLSTLLHPLAGDLAAPPLTATTPMCLLPFGPAAAHESRFLRTTYMMRCGHALAFALSPSKVGNFPRKTLSLLWGTAPQLLFGCTAPWAVLGAFRPKRLTFCQLMLLPLFTCGFRNWAAGAGGE